MRHPSAAIKEDDLSRLTTSSSSTSSGNNGSFFIPDCGDALPTTTLNCSYLPEVIDPLEWQSVSRKRKERQDSTSSTTQDRKLVRSNSEEYIPCADYEVIRRVFSHEEFKHPLRDKTNANSVPALVVEQCIPTAQQSIHSDPTADKKTSGNEIQDILSDANKRAEISPARSRTFDYSHKYRISPHRDGLGRNGAGSASRHSANGGTDEIEVEHERRRTSERFCKARAQPGRKQHSSKKPSKHLASRLRGGHDENSYKYEKTFSKSERRAHTVQSKVDEYVSNKKEKSIDDEAAENHAKSWSLPLQNDNKIGGDFVAARSPKPKRKHETLPWDRSFQDDTPVVCPRFSGSTFDHVYHSRNNIASNNHLPPPSSSNNGLSALGHLTKIENNKTREIMQSLKSPNVFSTSDEKLKQVSKRLTALKKRAILFEDTFEKEHGFRPSQADKCNDRFFKGIITEIHKLRKEKQHLKSDSGQAARFKFNNSTYSSVNRVGKMNETLKEIEKRLREKRTEENRSFELNQLSTDQLVQEKTAVQRALLYFESLFGRPNSREERDSVRFLYDRYRAIKRSLNRSASLTSTGFGGLGDLPTIHEHEAMQFIGKEVSSSVDLVSLTQPAASDKSPISTSAISTDSTDTTSSVHENIHNLSLTELWKHLEVAREEKRELRRTIKEFEEVFEEQNGRRMLKSDRFIIEETYGLYKQKKAKLRLLDALVKKNMGK